MGILEYVRSQLGVSSNRDAEITALINSAKMDMKIKGVVSVDDTDEFTQDVIADYCKAAKNFQGDALRYEQRYAARANTMAQTSIYNNMEGIE